MELFFVSFDVLEKKKTTEDIWIFMGVLLQSRHETTVFYCGFD